MRLLPLILLLAACNLDPDEDGLIRREERAAGTDPKSADSDGDGLSDGDEAERGTDPRDDDSDDDAVLDGAEVEAGTDPLDADSDDDGLDDGEEAALGTDPLDVDTDDDRIGDFEEGERGTDPLDPDSDDDGLDDGDDADAGADPLDPDTDDDGVLDGEEIALGTHVLLPDSDYDGYTDGQEVDAGTDPTDELDRPYTGGWPWRIGKDALTEPDEGATLTTDERAPRARLPDQHGETVDLYDLGGDGTPVVLLLGIDDAATASASDIVRGAVAAPEGLEALPGAVEDRTLVWAHVLLRTAEGEAATPDDARRWYAAHPDASVPTLSDPDGTIAGWIGELALPALVICDADLVVRSAGPLDEMLDDVVDTILD